MKTTTLLRLGMLPFLALLVFACKKEVQTRSSSFVNQAKSGNSTIQKVTGADWSIDIAITKNECDEQVFTLTALNQNGKEISEGDGEITFTISDANRVVETQTGASGMVVTTHLAAGSYSLSAIVSAGVNQKGESFGDITVEACSVCPYKSLDELTCEDMPASMEIGDVTYDHNELCQLLAYNRGNNGYGALVRLAQAVLVAKVNGFTSDNEVVAAAEALIGTLNALDPNDQASVVDQYCATEKGHVQDLVKCDE